MDRPSVRDVQALLGGADGTAEWLDALAALDGLEPPEVQVALPAADDLAPFLVDLAVPHQDIDDLVALLPVLEGSAELRWLLDRGAGVLARHLGSPDRPPTLPRLIPGAGVLRGYFYVYLFAAVLPHVRAFHRGRGIDDDTSRRTQADLGRNVAVCRRRHGVGGLPDGAWLSRHFGGTVYQLGRLQFERARLGNRTGQEVAASGLPFRPGDPVLAVHVPEFSGPITPRACEASFDAAVGFYARHFPAEPFRLAVCHSWLLDSQLADYLPADSNIIRFQRGFTLAERHRGDEDEPILRFVFGWVGGPLADLPRRTTLQRAILDHLAAGRHWHTGAGWRPLPPPAPVS